MWVIPLLDFINVLHMDNKPHLKWTDVTFLSRKQDTDQCFLWLLIYTVQQKCSFKFILLPDFIKIIPVSRLEQGPNLKLKDLDLWDGPKLI